MTHREANAAVQRALGAFFEGDDPGALVRTHGWLHIAEGVLGALRALPVEQRMEAMGMEAMGLVEEIYDCRCGETSYSVWTEAPE